MLLLGLQMRRRVVLMVVLLVVVVGLAGLLVVVVRVQVRKVVQGRLLVLAGVVVGGAVLLVVQVRLLVVGTRVVPVHFVASGAGRRRRVIAGVSAAAICVATHGCVAAPT